MADFKSAGAAIIGAGSSAGAASLFATSQPSYARPAGAAAAGPIGSGATASMRPGSTGAAGGGGGGGLGGAANAAQPATGSLARRQPFSLLDDGSAPQVASDPLTQIYGPKSRATAPLPGASAGVGAGVGAAAGGSGSGALPPYRKPSGAGASLGGAAAQPFATTAPIPAAMTLEHASPVTRLLEQRKEMLRVQENLDASKEEYARKEELFRRREEALRKKDLELQESLVLFNKYLRENEYKLSRALGTFHEQKNQIELKKREIIAKRKEKAAKKAEIEALKKEVRKKRKYRDYLERVQAQHSNVFDGIPAIIDRYQTLSETRRTFREMEEHLTRQAEEVRKELNAFKQSAENETLDLNILFSNLGKELQVEVDKASEEQERVQKAEDKLNQSRERTVKLRWAVDHCFTRCLIGSEPIAKVRNKIREDKNLTATHSKQQRINMLASPSLAAAIHAQQAAEKEKQKLLDAKQAAAGKNRDKNAPQVTTSEADITKAVNQLEVIELILEDFSEVIKRIREFQRKPLPATYQGRPGATSPRPPGGADGRGGGGGGAGAQNLHASQDGSLSQSAASGAASVRSGQAAAGAPVGAAAAAAAAGANPMTSSAVGASGTGAGANAALYGSQAGGITGSAVGSGGFAGLGLPNDSALALFLKQTVTATTDNTYTTTHQS